MNNSTQNRISVKIKQPNPLFEEWITQWRDSAKEKNSKMQYCFNTALQSLKKYPLPLDSGRDCKILKGFGDKLCTMLDNKLKEYKVKGSSTTVVQSTKLIDEIVKTKPVTTKPTLSKGHKEYIPQYRSGGYGILLAMYNKSLQPNYIGYMSKVDIIRNGKSLVDNSFTKPEPGSRYTAWSSMKKLFSEELVVKKSNPAKFSLTDKGVQLARKLSSYDAKSVPDVSSSIVNNLDLFDNNKNEHCDFKDLDILETNSNTKFKKYASSSSIDSKKASTSSSQNSNTKFKKYASSNSIESNTEEFVVYGPNTFDVILLVDTQETCGKNKDKQDDPLLAELTRLCVSYEVQNLKVGDYAWICRSRTSNVDLVLPYIIERKRMDDFASSIKDGRYYEQKFRLKRSGIKNITYLIESYGNNDHHVGLPLTTLYQAATNTAIQDGFCVKFTANLRGTAEYLSCFSGLLTNMFKSKTMASCRKEDLPEFSVDDDLVSVMTFKEFNRSSTKNKKMFVKDLFVKTLVQIKGMSVEKALAIVGKYPTPKLLCDAYKECPGPPGEKLLASIQFGSARKNIGIVLSKIVHQLFTTQF